MDAVVQFLLEYGYAGMWLSAFLAGTVIPFSSEVVLIALVKMGLDPMLTILAATFGNVVGGMTCYWIGHLGNMHWIEHYFKVSPKKIARAERFVRGRGAWMGFFAFVPILGSAISIVLGMMRANIPITVTAMALGKFLRYIVLIYITEGLASFGTNLATSPAEDGQPHTLTVSIEPMRFLTERIAGGAFEVVCMVPKGSSPESYEPTPKQLVDIARSSAYLRTGPIEFEQMWMERLQAHAPQMQVADMAEGVEFIHSEGAPDPHIWTSPRNVRRMARNICHTLCRLSPADSAEFVRRWKSLDSLVVQTDSLVRTTLSAGADSVFLLYHPALAYFARDYGLQALCVEEGGKEPSPLRLKQLTDECRRKGVRTLFVQRGFDTRSVQAIARETGAHIVEADPLAYDWDKELVRIASELTRR